MRVIIIIIVIIIIPAAHVRSWRAVCSAAGALATCARAYCWSGIAANLPASMALHVLCMCCACAVL